MESVDRSVVVVLSNYFVGSATLHETLTRVVELTEAALPQTMFAGISMDVEGSPDTYAFSDPETREVDQSQYDTGKGPCLAAFRTGEVVLVRSVAEPGGFEEFKATAKAHGVGSVLSVPLNTAIETVGALNIYAHNEDAFDDNDVEVAKTYATQAAFLLVNAKAYWDARTLNESLTEAMKHRAVIEQAKGIIMATSGLDADRAFGKLVMQSQHENIKLRDLAQELVQNTVK